VDALGPRAKLSQKSELHTRLTPPSPEPFQWSNIEDNINAAEQRSRGGQTFPLLLRGNTNHDPLNVIIISSRAGLDLNASCTMFLFNN
jgi:hypothetical protein